MQTITKGTNRFKAHYKNIIETLLQTLKEIRENAEKEFQILFEKVKVSNLSFN